MSAEGSYNMRCSHQKFYRRRCNRYLSQGYIPQYAQICAAKGNHDLMTLPCIPTSKTLKVAILPKMFPNDKLSRNNLKKLENILIEEMRQECREVVKFEKIATYYGFIIVSCIGNGTVKWLKCLISNLKSIKNMELNTCFEYKIPQDHFIEILLPNSADKDPEEILLLIKAQNEGLSSNKWRIYEHENKDAHKLMKVTINQKSLKFLKKVEFHINYRYGYVDVTYLKNKHNVANVIEFADYSDDVQ